MEIDKRFSITDTEQSNLVEIAEFIQGTSGSYYILYKDIVFQIGFHDFEQLLADKGIVKNLNDLYLNTFNNEFYLLQPANANGDRILRTTADTLPDSFIPVIQDTRNYEIGTYIIEPSFSFSRDDTGDDFIARCFFDGNSVNPVANEILQIEMKDSGGVFTVNGVFTGTNQKDSYHNLFVVDVTTAGSKTLLLEFGGDDGGVEKNIWNAVIRVKRIV